MIRDIIEVNFPDYATLSTAQVSQSDMGDKVITATVKIDGNIIPDFSYDWVVEFQGEKYIHPLRKPQASKENTDIRSNIDLTFRHWAIVELQRYFFVEMSSIETGTAIPDKYVASLSLHLGNFIAALNKVLAYWYGDRIRAELFKGDDTHPAWQYALEPTTVSISYSTVWDVLAQLYELYAVRWQIVADPENPDRAIIQFGFPTTEIEHIFEYGFKGGLLKVERQVQSDDIRNVILGRGGEKNVPYRYFKTIDPDNPSFPQDPDWIPELANIYFDRIRDAAFRSYVQGWKARHWQANDVRPENPGQFVSIEQSAVPWAYRKGYNDEKFDPVEFVADRIVDKYDVEPNKPIEIYPQFIAQVANDSSIDKYGVKFGALSDNDDIFPTIQGMVIDPYGRIDQAVDVGEVVSKDDGENSSSADAELSTVKNIKGTATHVLSGTRVALKIPIVFYGDSKYLDKNNSSTITIPKDMVGNFLIGSPVVVARRYDYTVADDYGHQIVIAPENIVVKFYKGNQEYPASGLYEGTYTAEVTLELHNTSDYDLNLTVTFPESMLRIGYDTASNEKRYANTFDVWVKNIWNTTPNDGESAEDYAKRVWKPILGDREEQEARLVFATGLLSIAEDYQFPLPKNIETAIHYDTSKRIYDKDANGNPIGEGVPSHWRLTLACSDADYDTLGVLIPNAQTRAFAGDYFYFIGIDLPYLYYTEAEKRLTAYKRDELSKIKEINPTWVVNLDKVRIGRAQFDDFAPLLSQLHAGASLRLTDPRFLRTVETLYIQSITYNYKESSKDDPYIVPDVEIVLSDKYETTANPVATLQGDVSAIQKQIGSISNIEQIVRIVGDRLYLRKDGIADLSYSPTQFNSLVTSKDFRMGGIGGAGWGFYRDINGNAVIEIDRAIIRQDMEVNNLVINQITARGGMIIESAASMEISMVTENFGAAAGRAISYTCYFDQKQGTIGNLFQVDDVAYCNRWDAQNNTLKSYKSRVIEVGVDYVVLSAASSFFSGNGAPASGDVIVHYGNYTKAERQFVKVRDVVGGGYERYLEGLDSIRATGTEYYFVGRQEGDTPRWLIGYKDGEYAEWYKGKLNINGNLTITSTIDGKPINEVFAELGTYYIDLTREMVAIPCDAEGKPLSSTPVTFKATIYAGAKEAVDFALTKPVGQHVDAEIDPTNPYEIIVYPETMTAETAEVIVYATNGSINLETVFTLYKVLPGADGESPTIYYLQADTDVILKSIDGTFSPNSVTLTKYENNAETGIKETTQKDFYIQRIGVDSALVRYTGLQVSIPITNETTALLVELHDPFSPTGITYDRLTIPVLTDATELSYLARSLEDATKESTSIEGGLILSSLLRLGHSQQGYFQVRSGLNGIYYGGDTPAFWAGGEMIDADIEPDNPDRATAMIRMDGTGYLADNTVRFRGSTLELGKNLVLSENTLSLGVDGQTCVAFGNQRMPDNLAELATGVDRKTSSGGDTAIQITRTNDLWERDGEHRSVFDLSPVILTDLTPNTVANIHIRVRLYIVEIFAGFDPSAYNVEFKVGNTTTYSRFVKDGSYAYADATIYNVPINSTTLTINSVMHGAGAYTPTADVVSEGLVRISEVNATIQRHGANMTLLGNNGFFSSWEQTAMGINETTAIIRAGESGILADVSGGIKIMLDGSNWLTLSRRSSDGALLLN